MIPIAERLRAANPVPDPTTAMDDAVYRAVLERAERASDVAWWRPDPQLRQKWYFAAATLLVGLALAGLLTWVGGRPDELVAAASPDVRIARAYVEARNDRDADTALTLLAPGATLGEYPVVRDVAEIRAAFRYLDLADEKLHDIACESTPATPAVISCAYSMNNRFVEMGRTGPVPGVLRLTVDGDQIVAIDNAMDNAAYIVAIDGWTVWLEQNHQGGSDALFRWTFQLDRIVASPRLDALDELTEAIARYDSTN